MKGIIYSWIIIPVKYWSALSEKARSHLLLLVKFLRIVEHYSLHQGICFKLFSTPHPSSHSHVSILPKGIWGSTYYIIICLLNPVKSIKLLPSSLNEKSSYKNSHTGGKAVFITLLLLLSTSISHQSSTSHFKTQTYMLVEAKYLLENLKLQYKGIGQIVGNILFTCQPSLNSPSPATGFPLTLFYLLPFFYISKLSPPSCTFSFIFYLR